MPTPYRSRPPFILPYLHLCLPFLLLAGLTLAGGCAVGRTADGKVNFGLTLDDLPQNASEAIAKAAGFLPEPWGTLAVGAGTLILGGGGVGAMARRARAREDRAFDEGVERGAAATPPPVAPARSASRLGPGATE